MQILSYLIVEFIYMLPTPVKEFTMIFPLEKKQIKVKGKLT